MFSFLLIGCIPLQHHITYLEIVGLGYLVENLFHLVLEQLGLVEYQLCLLL